ncbi:hypothetical protein VOI54_06425 [Tamlana sp. 2201CG12-4]|uniref:hypothetical protein n=1 Tax=Tamlana sp. 2201CG12-4 TaxID=3112582 RepID=UPI002DB86277|nr:hypothetical protein [Tamlana sp. 2201CG12-4]MEC3906647.1 hypothetical protein [Tamlana sp. 2201CG12-4]
MYYRRQEGKPYAKYVYNKDNPNALSQVIRYRLEGDVYEIVYYDYDGRKILEEDYEDGRIIYSCELNGRKRHGKEFCVSKECDTAINYFNNGRRVKN